MLSVMIVRPVSHAARRVAGELARRSRQQLLWHRRIVTMHDAKALFVVVGRFGVLDSKEITISRAGEDESSVLIAREVGLAMKAALMRQIGESLTDDPEVIPLKFYHRSLHFAHGMARFRADITY